MKSYYNKDTNCTVKVYLGQEVTLPDDSDNVEITHYAKNDLISIKRKSHYSKKIKVCCDTDTLVDELTYKKKHCNNSDNHNRKESSDNPEDTVPKKVKVKENKKHCNNSDIQDSNEKKCSDKSEDTIPKKAKEKGNKKSCNNSNNLSERLENCIEKNGVIIDVETGEIVERCRQKNSLQKSWYRAKEYILNSIYWRTAVFITVALDIKPSYDEMSNLASGYTTYLKTPFKGQYECGVTFLEPCEDGSWHAHLIIGFNDSIPEIFEKRTKKWWKKHNNNKTETALEYQTKFQLFSSCDDLIKVINYLNPTSKKKKDRIKYYPLSSQPIRKFGKTSDPKKAITTYETAKKIAGSEKPAMRKKVTIIDLEIKAVLFEVSEYYFVSNIIAYQRQRECNISENVDSSNKENNDFTLQTNIESDNETYERDNSGWSDFKYDWCMAHLY